MSAVAAPLTIDTRRQVRLGIGLVVVGFCGFFIWAALAPLRRGMNRPGGTSAAGPGRRIGAGETGDEGTRYGRIGAWAACTPPASRSASDATSEAEAASQARTAATACRIAR